MLWMTIYTFQQSSLHAWVILYCLYFRINFTIVNIKQLALLACPGSNILFVFSLNHHLIAHFFFIINHDHELYSLIKIVINLLYGNTSTVFAFRFIAPVLIKRFALLSSPEEIYCVILKRYFLYRTLCIHPHNICISHSHKVDSFSNLVLIGIANSTRLIKCYR